MPGVPPDLALGGLVGLAGILKQAMKVAVFVAAIWCVFLADIVLPGNFSSFGLEPRHISGLVGIVTMPFLHGSWDHLVGNTVPLIVLLCLLAGSKANTYRIVPQIIFLGGLLLWVLGRPNSIHVGASGLIYGLIAFLIVAGFREGRIGALAIAIMVGFMYGATLLGGILPISVDASVSWDGHLMGAIAGGLVARWSVTSEAKSHVDIT